MRLRTFCAISVFESDIAHIDAHSGSLHVTAHYGKGPVFVYPYADGMGEYFKNEDGNLCQLLPGGMQTVVVFYD